MPATYESLIEGYSDCYKSLYNFRPTRPPTLAQLIAFWDDYESNFAIMQAQEAAELASLGFATWAEYSTSLDAAYEAELEEWLVRRAEAQAYFDAYHTRQHPLPVIEAWEHGDIN